MSLGKLGRVKFGGVLKILAIVVIVLGGVMAAFNYLKKNFSSPAQMEWFQTMAASLSGVIKALALLMFVMNGIGKNKFSGKTAGAALLSFVLEIGVIVGAIALLANMKQSTFEKAKTGVLRLGDLLGTLASGFLSGIGIDFSKFNLLTMAQNFAAEVDSLRDTLVAIPGKINEVVQSFGEVSFDGLSSIFMGFAGVAGAIARFGWSSILGKLMPGVFGIGSIEGFLEDLAASNIAASLRKLTSGVSITQKDVETVTGIATSLEALVGVQSKMIGFSDDFVNVSKTTTSNITEGMESYSETISGKTSWADRIMGLGTLTEFATELTGFVPEFNNFLGQVRSLEFTDSDKEAIGRVADAAQALVDVQSSMIGFDKESIAGWIKGIGNLEDFGEQLGGTGDNKFGETFTKFSQQVSGITQTDVDNIKMVADATQALVDVQSSMKGFSDGFSIESFVKGIGDLQSFGKELSGDVVTDKSGTMTYVKGFASYFKSFADTVSTITPEQIAKVNSITEPVQALASAQQTLTLWSGAGMTTSRVGLGDFGSELETFGTHFATFNDAISGHVDAEAIGEVSGALTTFSELTVNNENLEALGDSLTVLGNGLGNFAKPLIDIDWTTFDKAATSIALMTAAIVAMGDLSERGGVLEGFRTQGSANISAFITAIKDLADADELDDIIQMFSSEELTNQLNLDEGSSFVKGIATEVENAKSDLENAGKKVVEYFVQGMKDNKSQVEEAAKELAEASVPEIKEPTVTPTTSPQAYQQTYQGAQTYQQAGETVAASAEETASAVQQYSTSAEIQNEADQVGQAAENMQQSADEVTQAGVTTESAIGTLLGAYGQLQQEGFDWSTVTTEDGINQLTNALFSSAQDQGLIDQEMSEYLSTMQSSIEEAAATGDYSAMDPMLEGMGDYAGEYISSEYGDQIESAMSNLGIDPNILINSLSTGEIDSSALVDMVASAIDPSGQMINDQIKQVLTAGVDGALQSSGSESAVNWLLGFANGTTEGMSPVSSAIQAFTTGVVNTTGTGLGENSPSTITNTMGKYWDQGLANGIRSNVGLVRGPVALLVQAALEGLNNIQTQTFERGKWFVEGFVNGIDQNKYQVNAKIQQMASEALQTLDAAMNSNSPSKETIQRGRWFDQGFAIGIDKDAHLVDKSISSMGDDALSGINDVVTRIIDAINGNFDMDPTIRPVLDLSEIQNGASRIGSMFGGYGFSPNLNYARTAAYSVNRGYAAAQAPAESDSHMVVEAIREMRGDIAGLQTAITGMQVVMNNGALVGQISPGVSSWIDRNTTYKKRGM